MESGQQRSCVRFRDLAVQYLLIVIQMLTSSIKIQVTQYSNEKLERGIRLKEALQVVVSAVNTQK